MIFYLKSCSTLDFNPLKASTNPNEVSRLKSMIEDQIPQMAPARYSRSQPKDGWPGRQKGDDLGKYTTGWCDPIV